MEESSNSRREEAIRLRNTGLTYKEIGHRLGVTKERSRQLINVRATDKKRLIPTEPNAMLTITQATRILGIHTNTLRRWSNQGILETFRVGARGDRRFRRLDIENLLFKKSTNIQY
jgi:DNA-binding transcriptional MerR regulator